MANIKSAKKRARQNIVRRLRNRQTRSSVRSLEKRLVEAITKKDQKSAQELLVAFTSSMGKAAQKGIYHAKTTSRKVSRLATKVASI